MSRLPTSKNRASKARPRTGKAGAKAQTGVARRLLALMQDDLGGSISFNALAYVKAELHKRVSASPNFKAVKEGIDRGDYALDIVTQSVESHPIEQILEAQGQKAACASGCAFCCILTPDGNGGPITRAEAERLFDGLVALRGTPDGRDWHIHACPALDPESRMCRAYEVRPILCRSTASANADTCAALAEGDESQGTNARHAAAYMQHVAQELGRRAMGAPAPTYGLSTFAAAVVDGADLDTALKAAQHSSSETAEITRDAIAAFAQATRAA